MKISWTFFVLIIFNLNEIIRSDDDKDREMKIAIKTHNLNIPKNLDVHVISNFDGSDLSSPLNEPQEKNDKESGNSFVKIIPNNDMKGSIQFEKKIQLDQEKTIPKSQVYVNNNQDNLNPALTPNNQLDRQNTIPKSQVYVNSNQDNLNPALTPNNQLDRQNTKPKAQVYVNSNQDNLNPALTPKNGPVVVYRYGQRPTIKPNTVTNPLLKVKVYQPPSYQVVDLGNNMGKKSINNPYSDVPTGEEKDDDTNPPIYNLPSKDEKSIPETLPKDDDTKPQIYNLPPEDEKRILKPPPRGGYSATYSGAPKYVNGIPVFPDDDTNPPVYNLPTKDERSIPKDEDTNPPISYFPIKDEKSSPKSLSRGGYSVTYSGGPKSDEEITSFTGNGKNPPVYDWGSNGENSKLKSPPRGGYSATYNGPLKYENGIPVFPDDDTNPPIYSLPTKDDRSIPETLPKGGYSVTYSGVPKSNEDMASFKGDGKTPPVYNWGSYDKKSIPKSAPKVDELFNSPSVLNDQNISEHHSI